MSFDSESFTACETLIKRHGPLLMRVGDYKEPVERKHGGRPRIPRNTVKRIKRLRHGGKTIRQIALRCQVSWRTVWHYSQ